MYVRKKSLWPVPLNFPSGIPRRPGCGPVARQRVRGALRDPSARLDVDGLERDSVHDGLVVPEPDRDRARQADILSTLDDVRVVDVIEVVVRHPIVLDDHARLPGVQQEPDSLVHVGGVAESTQLEDPPVPGAVHLGVHAPQEWSCTGQGPGGAALRVSNMMRAVDRLQLDPGHRYPRPVPLVLASATHSRRQPVLAGLQASSRRGICQPFVRRYHEPLDHPRQCPGAAVHRGECRF